MIDNTNIKTEGQLVPVRTIFILTNVKLWEKRKYKDVPMISCSCVRSKEKPAKYDLQIFWYLLVSFFPFGSVWKPWNLQVILCLDFYSCIPLPFESRCSKIVHARANDLTFKQLRKSFRKGGSLCSMKH